MLGHNAPKQCSYNYPSMNVREYVDFSQKLARWGESGVYGFLNHFDSREVSGSFFCSPSPLKLASK